MSTDKAGQASGCLARLFFTVRAIIFLVMGGLIGGVVGAITLGVAAQQMFDGIGTVLTGVGVGFVAGVVLGAIGGWVIGYYTTLGLGGEEAGMLSGASDILGVTSGVLDSTSRTMDQGTTLTIQVACSPAQAFEFVANFKNYPTWQDVLEIKQLSPGVDVVGATYQERRRAIGNPGKAIFEVTVYEPPAIITYEYTSATMQFPWRRRSYTFTPVEGGGTEVVCTVELSRTIVGGLTSLSDPYFLEQDLAKLKKELDILP
jgi:hypothetical protein